ncbi:MAG: NAD-dependent deacylase [Anaerolineales bacterium]|nr:NAD-dependent deacylase [Anaerolineales bacterium]
MLPFNIPQNLVDALRQATAVAVLTGAGISAESGVPTFREAQTGLWAQYDPQELATPEAFRRNPKLVWEWYAWRRELVAQAAPNPGHHALAQMAYHVPRLTLITQNVDGLHQAAGSQHPIELHGNLSRIKCFDEDVVVAQWADTGEVPPRCPRCGGPLRPDVVWFGENLPHAAWQQAAAAARACQVFFSIGTSALVQPAASLPLDALENGALVVEINPQPTPLTHYVDLSLRGPAGEVLPALVEATWAADKSR